jgi:hypothetical protein
MRQQLLAAEKLLKEREAQLSDALAQLEAAQDKLLHATRAATALEQQRQQGAGPPDRGSDQVGLRPGAGVRRPPSQHVPGGVSLLPLNVHTCSRARRGVCVCVWDGGFLVYGELSARVRAAWSICVYCMASLFFLGGCTIVAFCNEP